MLIKTKLALVLLASALPCAIGAQLLTVEEPKWIGDDKLFEPGRLEVMRWMRRCAYTEAKKGRTVEQMEAQCGPGVLIK